MGTTAVAAIPRRLKIGALLLTLLAVLGIGMASTPQQAEAVTGADVVNVAEQQLDIRVHDAA